MLSILEIILSLFHISKVNVVQKDWLSREEITLFPLEPRVEEYLTNFDKS